MRDETITVAQLRPGDRIFPLEAPGEDERWTVKAVQYIGPLAIIDFADGTATAPLPSHSDVKVRTPR